jgi:PAS domain S-box-containing protein
MTASTNPSDELLEAYETLRAIRDGEVDAFVLLTQGGYRVATLSASDTPYRVFVEAMRDGALTVDQRGSVVYCNPPFVGALGRSAEEVIGQSAWDFIELSLPFAEVLARAKSGEVRCDGWLATESERVPVAVTICELATDDPSTLLCLVLADLRDRVAAEALRAKQRERERHEQMRETFVGILGHDLRTPLSAILNGAQLLERGGLPEQAVRRAAGAVRRSAERMQRLIDDMLDLTLSRIGGGIPLAPVPMDLADTLESALAELKSHTRDLRCELSRSGDTTGEWDRERLQQVAQNLLSNAAEHGSKLEPIRVSLRGTDRGIELQVTNGGTPIPPDIQQHLFEPFRRGTEPSPARGRGVGLGLYITERIVDAHGGTIDVASNADGTTFTVRLPRRVPNAPRSEPPPA